MSAIFLRINPLSYPIGYRYLRLKATAYTYPLRNAPATQEARFKAYMMTLRNSKVLYNLIEVVLGRKYQMYGTSRF